MIKNDYQKELNLSKKIVRKGERGKNVEKIQEWLNLFNFSRKGKVIAVDGDFGPITEKTVEDFQRTTSNVNPKKLEIDGIVGPNTWRELIRPLKYAFTHEPQTLKLIKAEKISKREVIVLTAARHLTVHPKELAGKNEGPWVRAYMGGHDGNPWAWCVGSALAVIDQALSAFDEKFTKYYPDTYSCDVMGNHAKKKKSLIRNKKLREMSISELHEKVQPGDLFQIVKTPTDWTHCGIILEVCEDHIVTAEGNTNDEGSREGYEFVKRKRNFRKQNLDILTLKIK